MPGIIKKRQQQYNNAKQQNNKTHRPFSCTLRDNSIITINLANKRKLFSSQIANLVDKLFSENDQTWNVTFPTIDNILVSLSKYGHFQIRSAPGYPLA